MAVWRFGCGLDGILAGLGSHVMANRVAKSQWHPCLGPSWAMLGHVGALLEGPGRHLEADSGLGGTILEPTCGKRATCQKLEKTIEKTRCFDD